MDAVWGLLEALHADPADHGARLALADALEEAGRAGEAEAARLHARQLMRVGSREELVRLCALLEGGVRPVVPEVVNSIGMRLALIPPGAFLMGSPEDEDNRVEHEGPQREVTLTRPFYLGVCAVTQAEYERVMGQASSYFSAVGGGSYAVRRLDTSRFPVESVSHADAARFCKRLSAQPEERRAGRKYRLPTEAEWERSCRGGSGFYQVFHVGDSLGSAQANFDGQYPYGGAVQGAHLGRPGPVGLYPPNAFGLYDLHGNVFEWCSDYFGAVYYQDGPAVDPTGPPVPSYRVVRGGCWDNMGMHCRSAYRGTSNPRRRDNWQGFRVAMVLSGEKG